MAAAIFHRRNLRHHCFTTRRHRTTGLVFRGLFDDSAIGNTNLSDADVLSLYTDEVDRNSASLVGFWRFNEGENQTVVDLSSALTTIIDTYKGTKMLNRRFKSRVVAMLVLPCVSLFASGQELGDIETIINEGDSSFLIPVLQAGTDLYRVQLDYEDPYWSVAEVTPVSNASVNSGSYADGLLSLSCALFQGQHYTVTMGLVNGTDPLMLELLSYSVTDCSSPPCDIKLENAQIYTFDILATQATTLTIRGNTIEAIGTAAAAQSCTETIDAAGRVVIPGLNDNHVHYSNRINAGGHVVAEMDTARSQADVIRILQEAIAIQNVPAVSGAVSVRNFLVTEGGDHQAALIEGSWPNLAALNAVDRPVFLIEGRDNAGWVNQAAKDFFDTAGVGNVASNGQVLDPVGAKNHLLNLESDADRQEDWLDGNRWAVSVG